MDEKEVKTIVSEAVKNCPGKISTDDIRLVVKESVKETLISLGINACDPMEMQEDLHYLRNLRESSKRITFRSKAVAVGVLVTALAGAVYLGIKTAFTGG